MNNPENKSSRFFLIAGIAVLILIMVFAYSFYAKNAGKKTSAEEKALQEMSQSKENADKKGEEQDTASEADENEPVKAPDFTVYTKDGTAVNFSDKIGKPVLINFWATWCGPCKGEMPYFEKAYKEYGDKIEFMMINPTDGVNDTHENVDKFLADYGYTFPVYRDTSAYASYVYGIRAFPTTVLVNKDGYFIGGYEGAMSEEMLDEIIKLLLPQ